MIDAVAPMARVDELLLELLEDVTLEEWERETIVPGWRVRHVAAHLLDTATRKLTLLRDGFFSTAPGDDLVAFINRLNAEGVAVYGRLSPQVMRSLTRPAVEASAAWHAQLDPMAKAAFAVSWAGESESLNWFDTARELTERWHHQQQIRLALGREGLMVRELYHPVLECFLRVLPQAYRGVVAPEGTVVRVTVAGECGGNWFLHRTEGRWLFAEPVAAPAAAITIPQEIAWRVFTKGVRPGEAEAMVQIENDRALALPVLSAVAIVG